jgi:hypothetical protein
MAKTTQALIVLVIASAAFIAGRAGVGADPAALGAMQPGRTEAPQKPAKPSNQQEMMALAQPGEPHKHLELLLGNWEGELKVWFAPGRAPMTFKASKQRESLFGKRFVIEHVEMSSDMGPIHALGIMGYNNAEKRYESFYIDDGGTAMIMSTGTFDTATKTFTFTGDENDMTGKKVQRRMTLDCSNKDQQIMAGFKPGRDGQEFKSYECTYTRKK